MGGPAASAYAVLALGALGGGVVKGLTGFGSAIINLLAWVAATSVGVDGGTLTQAVVAECLSCVVCAVPLLLMTSAHKTASWRLLLATTSFAAAGAPLGALLLHRLNARVVELVMGCILLMVLALQAKLHKRMGRALHGWRHGRLGSEQSFAEDSAIHPSPPFRVRPNFGFSGVGSSGLGTECSSMLQLSGACAAQWPEQPRTGHSALEDITTREPICASARTAQRSARPWSGMPALDCGSVAVAFAAGADDSTAQQGSFPVQPAPAASSCSDSALVATAADCGHAAVPTHGSHTVAAVPPIANAGRDVEAAPQDGQIDDEAAPLLDGLATAPRGAAAIAAPARTSIPPTSRYGCGPGAASRACHTKVLSPVQTWLARQDWPEFRRALLYGSGAGFASGVMGGLTGMSGPPIILMYERLQIAKDVVRGTNAVGNVLQVRLIAYIALGVLRREDFPLYGMAAAVGLAGVGLGHRLAGRLDQRAFSRVLVALMVICCALLFLSAAGVNGHAP